MTSWECLLVSEHHLYHELQWHGTLNYPLTSSPLDIGSSWGYIIIHPEFPSSSHNSRSSRKTQIMMVASRPETKEINRWL
jgi:hypothetical protein